MSDGQGHDRTDMAERAELLRCAQRALEGMPTDRLRGTAEQLAGTETIQQVLRPRSERHHQARQ
ncbi:hypothetical protein OHR68_06450 [Spirillospora sp. NBC_00431]